MKNKYIIDYLNLLVQKLLKNDYDIDGMYDKEFWTPLVTFEEVKCVADFLRMFKGIDFKIEEETEDVSWNFRNAIIKDTSSNKYRLKFTIHKEFNSLNDSNKIDAKYKKYKNLLKIREIDNDF